MQKIALLFVALLATQVICSIPSPGNECTTSSSVTKINPTSFSAYIQKLFYLSKAHWYEIAAGGTCSYVTYESWKLHLEYGSTSDYYYYYYTYSSDCTTQSSYSGFSIDQEFHSLDSDTCGFSIVITNSQSTANTYGAVITEMAQNLAVAASLAVFGIAMTLY